MMYGRSLLISCAAMALTSAAHAQMTFSLQSRTASATGPGGVNSSASATNYDPVQFSLESPGANGGGSYATLNSTLDPLYISFQLSAALRPNGSNQFGTAASVHTIQFSTPTNCSFGFAGSMGFGTATLSGPGVAMTPNPTIPFYSYVGVFQAGQTYTLSVTTTASPGQDRGVSGTINITEITPAPQPAAFTYQGNLRLSGAGPINSPTDFRFALYPASVGGANIGPQITKNALPVSGGVFTTTLDFGAVFNGTERWLQVEARNPAGVGDFTAMGPRTRLDSAPYSAYALAAKAAPWAGISGVPANVSGAFSPWQAVSGGIDYSAGLVSVGNVTRELSLNSVDGLKIGAGGTLAFGAIGNTLGTADNTDFIAFKRVNLTTGTTNQSELRLYLGDDPTTAGNSQDYFTIGTISGGTWSTSFGFRSDGFASKPGGGSWANLSDPRAKHDVKPLTGTLDRLLALRGYQYLYNDDVVKSGKALTGPQIGLMADEVERVFPDWIFTDRDGMRMVSERATTALMVEALRDLRAEKDQVAAESRTEIQRLREENAQLRERLDRIERLLGESK